MSLGYPVCSATSASTAASTGSTPGSRSRLRRNWLTWGRHARRHRSRASDAGRFGARSRTNPITARNVG